MGWLCGVGVFGLIECPHCLPALRGGLQNNNNNNNKVLIYASYLQRAADADYAILIAGYFGISEKTISAINILPFNYRSNYYFQFENILKFENVFNY